MTQTSRLALATERLRAAFGTVPWADASSGWGLFLRLLLVGPASEISAEVAELLAAPNLQSPRATADTSTGQLVELLGAIPRGPQKSSLLRMVAEWWLETFGDQVSPDWSGSTADYRESLRRIRGLGPATVDELLLFAAQLPVVPLNRGTIRVAVRHGWLDLPIEDEESQDYFVRGLREAGVDGREFTLLVTRVADQFCGREPKCDGCPLQPLLPPGGPLNPESV